MELTDKIIFTIAFVIGAPLLNTMMVLINVKLKNSLEAKNPDLVRRTPWFFSSGKQRFTSLLIYFMTAIFLILMWADLIKIPVNQNM